MQRQLFKTIQAIEFGELSGIGDAKLLTFLIFSKYGVQIVG